MKKLTFLIIFILARTFIFSQDIFYNIERNSPHSYNNFTSYITPVSISASRCWVGFSWGAGGYYKFNDKFSADLNFQRSITKKYGINTFGYWKGENAPYPVGGLKNRTVMELTGQYFIGGFLMNKTKKIVLQDMISVTTYTKIKMKQFVSIPLRFSLGFYQNTLGTGIDIKNKLKFRGYNISDPSLILDNISGTTVYKAYTVNLGLAIYIADDFKASFRGAYTGNKDFKEMTFYYIDIILPYKQEFSDMIVPSSKIINGNYVITNQQYHINDHTIRSPYGLKAGMYYRNLEKVGGGSRMELGFKPGPQDLLTNFYVLLTIDVAFTKLFN